MNEHSMNKLVLHMKFRNNYGKRLTFPLQEMKHYHNGLV